MRRDPPMFLKKGAAHCWTTPFIPFSAPTSAGAAVVTGTCLPAFVCRMILSEKSATFRDHALVDRLVLDGLGGAADGDLARLLALGKLTLQVDMQQPVLERSAG